MTSVEKTASDEIFSAAQRGDITAVLRCLDSGISPNSRDDANITALHWASINAHLDICALLLDRGAEVDPVGGNLAATPLMWASRQAHLPILSILISHGADPALVDSQGFNALHLAVHSSSVLSVIYILQQPVAVDAADNKGHTPLMWAAYQGDALTVNVLLRYNASLARRDETGMEPLHWAVVKGNRNCIRALITAGADLTSRDSKNRTASMMAEELKSLSAYTRALADCGMNSDGRIRQRPLPQKYAYVAIFTLPTLIMTLIFSTFANLPWYSSIPIALGELYGMHHIITRTFLDPLKLPDAMTRSPYFAGIIAASMICVAFQWVSKLLGATVSLFPVQNGLFAISLALCVWNFYRAVCGDPGWITAPASDTELKELIEHLVSTNQFNSQTFCVYSFVRKPLRSKYCRIHEKVCARFDHHCPWIWNCVGVHNHRQFYTFVLSLVIGIILFDSITYEFYNLTAPILSPAEVTQCVFPQSLCTATMYDTFLFSTAAWASIQLSWTVVLLFAQTWQISKQITTLEASNLSRFGYMGGRPLASPPRRSDMSSTNPSASGGSSITSALGGNDGTEEPFVPNSRKPFSCFLQLLGLDVFTRSRIRDGLSRTGSDAGSNPFDLGVYRNVLDFWSKGGQLGVDYTKLYDVPPEGFRVTSARLRRARQMTKDGADRDSVIAYQSLSQEENA